MPETDGPSPLGQPDRTQAVSSPAGDADLSPDLGRTQSIAPPSPEGSVPAQEGPEERDRRLAAELAKRGVPPDEVQRLLLLGQPAAEPAANKPAAAAPPTIPPSEAFTPHPSIVLPEFRESTAQERIEADRVLTRANVARRRGDFREAELRCREAIELVPKDAGALELYGDILQAIGRVDDAVTAYGHARSADPSRKSAERKYAELTLAQNKEIELLRQEYIPRNPYVAVIFSAVFPGAGQIYNGEPVKGLITALVLLACVILLLWSPFGFTGSKALTGTIAALLVVIGIAYIYAVVDANVSARRGKRPKSGWEV